MNKHLILLSLSMLLWSGITAQTIPSSSYQETPGEKAAREKIERKIALKKAALERGIKSRTLYFDFNNPVPIENQFFPANKVITLQLLNVNPFLYEVSINDTLITFPNQKPPLFTELFAMPTLNKVQDVQPNTMNSNAYMWAEILKVKSIPEQEADQDSLMKKFIHKYSTLEDSTKKVLSLGDLLTELDKIVVKCNLDLEESKRLAQTYILSKHINGIDESAFPVGLQSAIDNMIASNLEAATDFIKEGEQLKGNYLISANEVSAIKELIDNAVKLKEKLVKISEVNLGQRIAESYDHVFSSRINPFKTASAGYGADQLLFKIKVKKLKEVNCPKPITSFDVKANIVGGVKIDFSAGPVLNFGRNKFFDQSYRKEPFYIGNRLTDSISIEKNNNNNQAMFSMGAFLHAYTRVSGYLNAGLVVGGSLGTDQRFYTHFGGSLIIGKSDRLILSGGLSIAKSDMLSSRYDEKQLLKTAIAPEIIPIEKVTRVGGFFSLTWNLNMIP